MSEPIIELQAVQLTLPSLAGEVSILRGIDLSVSAGDRLALVGPSGSGKTTTMMVIAGLERPTAGRVQVAGIDLTTRSEDELAEFRRRHLSIVFQAFHLVSSMTALENVAVPLELAGHRNAATAAENALARVGLAHRIHHYPSQLSGGEQQRVALARAFVTEPSILLADEPTGNLDADTGKDIIDLLFSLADQKGSTLLLITHDQALAKQCNTIRRMSDGRIVA